MLSNQFSQFKQHKKKRKKENHELKIKKLQGMKHGKKHVKYLILIKKEKRMHKYLKDHSLKLISSMIRIIIQEYSKK